MSSSLELITTTTTPSPDLLAAASTLQACLGSREAEPELSTMMTLRGSESKTSEIVVRDQDSFDIEILCFLDLKLYLYFVIRSVSRIFPRETALLV